MTIFLVDVSTSFRGILDLTVESMQSYPILGSSECSVSPISYLLHLFSLFLILLYWDSLEGFYPLSIIFTLALVVLLYTVYFFLFFLLLSLQLSPTVRNKNQKSYNAHSCSSFKKITFTQCYIRNPSVPGPR